MGVGSRREKRMGEGRRRRTRKNKKYTHKSGPMTILDATFKKQ